MLVTGTGSAMERRFTYAVPGRGVTPIAEFLAAIRDTGYDGTVSIELEFSPEPEKIVEWVAEAHDATAAILDTLGCRPARRR